MAAWLTIPGRNRELAEQSELLDEKIKSIQPVELEQKAVKNINGKESLP